MDVSAPIVVVGGGVTGLAAAHRLVERARAGEAIPPVLVLEAAERAGGQVCTERRGDVVLEAGPDTVVAQKPAAVALCARLGLQGELEDVAARHGGTSVLWNGKLHRVPEGFVMMAPTRLLPVLRSSLFSWRGKVRMAMEPLVRARPGSVDDESLASFVSRRFGREALVRAAEPIVASIFTADAERLSLRATLPRFLDLERRHGSVARGLSTAMTTNHAPASARPGAFVALRGGMSRLVEGLLARLPAGSVRTGARVDAIARDASGSLVVTLSGGERIRSAAVLLACPAFEGARMMRALDPALAAKLGELPYASCATVSLVYPRSALGAPLDSFGFFVPRAAALPILACSCVSEKFPARAPSDVVVLRAFLGGATRPAILDLSDAELERASAECLARILRIGGPPRAAFTHRFPRSMPQYDVGAVRWLEEVARRAAAIPGLAIVGSAAGAVGIPDAVRSGEEAADRLTISPGASAWVAYQANQYA